MAPVSLPPKPATAAIYAAANASPGNDANNILQALVNTIWRDKNIASPEPDASHIFIKPDSTKVQYSITDGTATLEIPSSVITGSNLGDLIQAATQNVITAASPVITAVFSGLPPALTQFSANTVIVDQPTLDGYIASDLGNAGFWPKSGQPNASYSYDEKKAEAQNILDADKAKFNADVQSGVPIADALGGLLARAEQETGYTHKRPLLSAGTRVADAARYAAPEAQQNLAAAWERVAGDTPSAMLAQENRSPLPASIKTKKDTLYNKDMTAAFEGTLAAIGINWKMNIEETAKGEFGAGSVDAKGNVTVVISHKVLEAEQQQAQSTSGEGWHDAEKVAAAYGLAQALLDKHRDLIEKTYGSVLTNPTVAAGLNAQFPDKNDSARKEAENQFLTLATAAGIMHAAYPHSPNPEATLAKYAGTEREDNGKVNPSGRAAISEKLKAAVYDAMRVDTLSNDAVAAAGTEGFIGEAEAERTGHDTRDKANAIIVTQAALRAAWGVEPINAQTISAALDAAKSITLGHAQKIGPKISWVTQHTEPSETVASGISPTGQRFTITRNDNGNGRG